MNPVSLNYHLDPWWGAGPRRRNSLFPSVTMSAASSKTSSKTLKCSAISSSAWAAVEYNAKFANNPRLSISCLKKVFIAFRFCTFSEKVATAAPDFYLKVPRPVLIVNEKCQMNPCRSKTYLVSRFLGGRFFKTGLLQCI